MNVVVLTVLQLKSIVMKEQINRTMEELWISSIVLSIKDENYAFADWKSKIKACFWKTAEAFLNAKFKKMILAATCEVQ